MLFSGFQVLEFTCIIHGGVNYGFKGTINIIYLDIVSITGITDRGHGMEERKKEIVICWWNKI